MSCCVIEIDIGQPVLCLDIGQPVLVLEACFEPVNDAADVLTLDGDVLTIDGDPLTLA